MEEKEGEYHAEMTAKLDWFRLQHAARVIQVAWKETLASRAEKAKVCDSYLHKKKLLYISSCLCFYKYVCSVENR